MTRKRPPAAVESRAYASLEEDYAAALHAHFRAHWAALLTKLAEDPVAFYRLVAGMKDKARDMDPIEKLTIEEVRREIARIEKRLAAGET